MAQYPCPQCGGKMYIEAVHEGYEVPCPHCGDKFRVPRGAAAAAGGSATDADSGASASGPPSDSSAAGPVEVDAPASGPVVELDGPSAPPAVTRSATPPARREPRVPSSPVRADVPPGQDPQGTMIFVLGLLSLLFCPFLGPIAWYMGHGARARAKAANRPVDGMVTAGWVLGIIGSAIILLYIGLFVIYGIVFAAAVGSGM